MQVRIEPELENRLYKSAAENAHSVAKRANILIARALLAEEHGVYISRLTPKLPQRRGSRSCD